MFKIRHNLSSKTLLLLYHALIQSYLDYCNIIWAVGSTYLLDSVFCKQKKAVRAIVFAKWNAHTSEIFKQLNVLTAYVTNKLQTCCFVYRSMHNLLPMSFCGLFTTNSLVHSHATRQKDQLNVISHHLNVRRHSIQIYGVKL